MPLAYRRGSAIRWGPQTTSVCGYLDPKYVQHILLVAKCHPAFSFALLWQSRVASTVVGQSLIKHGVDFQSPQLQRFALIALKPTSSSRNFTVVRHRPTDKHRPPSFQHWVAMMWNLFGLVCLGVYTLPQPVRFRVCESTDRTIFPNRISAVDFCPSDRHRRRLPQRSRGLRS